MSLSPVSASGASKTENAPDGKMLEEKKMNKVEMHDDICNALTNLYDRKNHDYGDSFSKSFAEYGMAMPCIRLEDKLNRLKALTRNSKQMVTDERIEDTLMDLANYAIMTLVEMKALEEDGDQHDSC